VERPDQPRPDVTTNPDPNRGSEPSSEESRPLGSHRIFADHHRSVDSVVTLFALAQYLATDAHVVVDVGCGRGAMIDPDIGERRLHDLRRPDRRVIGIDVDPVAAENPVIDEFRAIGEDGRWPLDDNSVDLALCDWVLEHIQSPADFVSELHRVLRPGGAFVARTISRGSPLSLGARLIPNRHHAKVLAKLQPRRSEKDVFPTVYRMNTPHDLGAVFDADFDWAVSAHPGMHEYASRPALKGVVRVVEPRIPRHNQLVLIVTARKRG
jgi:SAM-dependent methyltransferase